MRGSFLTIVVCSSVFGADASPSGEYTIGNEVLRLHLAVRDGKMATAAIENALTKDTIPIRGTEFRIRAAGGTEITDRDAAVTGVADLLLAGSGDRAPGRRLVVSAEAKAAGLRIDIIHEARDGETWIERYLEVRGPRPVVLEHVLLADWEIEGAAGPAGAGSTAQTLGYPSGCGQPIYARDLFLGVAHPGAENFVAAGRVACGIPAYAGLDPVRSTRTERMVIGAAERGGARRAFVRHIHRVRATPQRMIELVNDWYWKDKSKPVADLKALAAVKERSGVPIDSFTLDDGWSSYTNIRDGVWGALEEERLPHSWEDLVAAGAKAKINVSLWYGPIGGYGYRPNRIPLGRKLGYEIDGDKFCLAGERYRSDVKDIFARWANRGMDFIKVDGFWPDCRREGHGHPIGAGAAIAAMDTLCDVFASWRRARPDLVIAYTSGSNPSPFWLLHCDYVWRSGADDAHLGAGGPFDRYATFIDACLEQHRATEMPISGFVTFDLISTRMFPSDDAALERGFWWAAARTSLHHDWYLHPSDLTDPQWSMLARAARWAKAREEVFRTSRMIGGETRKGEAYGFACFDGKTGTLALRNPAAELRAIEGTLAGWLDLADSERNSSYKLSPVFGKTEALAGIRAATVSLRLELPPLEIAVFDVAREGGAK